MQVIVVKKIAVYYYSFHLLFNWLRRVRWSLREEPLGIAGEMFSLSHNWQEASGALNECVKRCVLKPFLLLINNKH